MKSVNFSTMMLNVKSGEKGDFDERYACGSLKLSKGRYSIIPFTNLKAVDSILLNLEVLYSCRETLLKFFNKSDKILDSCLGEPNESHPRRIRDTI